MNYCFFCPTEQDEVRGELLMRTSVDKNGDKIMLKNIRRMPIRINNKFYEYISDKDVGEHSEVIVAPINFIRKYNVKAIEL